MGTGLPDDYLGGTESQFDFLAKLGPGAALAIPELTKLIHHPSPIIQRLAAKALKHIDRK
jgi:hypothetical protein